MRTLVLGFVLLATTAAHAEEGLKNYVTNPNKYEDRSECIREMHEIWENMARAKRLCDPTNYVSNPNEYGWLRVAPECPLKRVKGYGWKQQKDAPCE